MKNLLNNITKKFLLNEQLKLDAGASIQVISDIVSNIRVNNQRDSNRLQVAKEHLRSIKRHLRTLNEKVSNLEEELSLLKEEK
jgi:hypothetical protein